MKKIIFILFLTFSLSSCYQKDNLDAHRGEVVLLHQDYHSEGKYLCFKEKNSVRLISVAVNDAEFEYYQDGDTIK